MALANFGIDSLHLRLTGGASNKNPDLSLGGVSATGRLRGLGFLVSDPVPAVIVDEVFPANGQGEGSLLVNPDGELVWTPPGGAAGSAVAVAAGQSCVVTGADAEKALRVTRETGLPWVGLDTLTLRNAYNGALSHANVADADRTAGLTTYRAIMLYAASAAEVQNIQLWLPPVAGAQATYAIGTEVAVGDTIQTIANEFTAPAAVVFTSPASETGAIQIPSLAMGLYLGLWIRRVFPAVGVVSVQEDFQLTIKYEGAG